MSRLLARALGAASAFLLAGAAAAQSNSLSGAGLPGAQRDLSSAVANGYTPFSLGAFDGYLSRSGFTVTERQQAPDGSGVGIVANAPNGMPFLFVFSDCGRQGCLFMEAVQPFAPKKIGMPISLAEMNAYNRNSPLQLFMTAEANDEVGLRWVMPALAGCGDACAHSAVTLYFGAVLNVYEAVSKASKQVLVEAPFDEPTGPVGFASLAAATAPDLTVDARWGAASVAVGSGSITDVAGPALRPEALSDRLSEEIERAVTRDRPGGVSFPALIGE